MEDIYSNTYSEENKIVSFNRYKEQRTFEQDSFKEYNYTLIGNNSNMEKYNKPKSYSREGDNTMDDNKILEKYLDTVDKDRRDMEQRLTVCGSESEKRIEEQRRLSEERMEKKYIQVLDTVQNIEGKIDKLGTEVRENNKSMRNTSIATIIGISTMAISIIAIVITVILK